MGCARETIIKMLTADIAIYAAIVSLPCDDVK